MTPAARIAAAIQLLGYVDEGTRPADQVAAAYWRSRRYIGAADRRAISDRLWGCLRRSARLAWWLETLQPGQAGSPPSPRLRVLADLMVSDHLSAAAAAQLYSGEAKAPPILSADEMALARRLEGHDIFHHDMPAWVRGEYPAWLEDRLQRRFGERLAAEMGALRDEAPVDLRVNTVKSDRASAQAALAAEGLAATPTLLSPLGLRLPARLALTAQQPFQDGLVEVQDEGSQLVALLTDARPGQAVMDFCAGAGGKTLALAAAMQNRGRLVACDIHAGRSAKAHERLRRAGVHNVQLRVLEGGNDKWLKRQAGAFDRVLVDAPCTGSGTWRRNPDAKWRLTPATISALLDTQRDILASAARLVKPGGRLIYATCSLFAEENEDQAAAFVAAHSDFSIVGYESVWSSVLGTPPPGPGPTLRLTPAGNGTDGFFAAIFERVKGDSAASPLVA